MVEGREAGRPHWRRRQQRVEGRATLTSRLGRARRPRATSRAGRCSPCSPGLRLLLRGRRAAAATGAPRRHPAAAALRARADGGRGPCGRPGPGGPRTGLGEAPALAGGNGSARVAVHDHAQRLREPARERSARGGQRVARRRVGRGARRVAGAGAGGAVRARRADGTPAAGGPSSGRAAGDAVARGRRGDEVRRRSRRRCRCRSAP